MEKTFAIISMIFSLCVLIFGCYVYFIDRKKKWIKINANVLRIHIIKKIDEKKKSKPISTISVKFGFKVGSVDYHPVFDDNLLGLTKNDIRSDLIKNKKLLIYYDIENPNISHVNMPNDGISFIFFGLILLIISLLYLNSLNYCKKKLI